MIFYYTYTLSDDKEYPLPEDAFVLVGYKQPQGEIVYHSHIVTQPGVLDTLMKMPYFKTVYLAQDDGGVVVDILLDEEYFLDRSVTDGHSLLTPVNDKCEYTTSTGDVFVFVPQSAYEETKDNLLFNYITVYPIRELGYTCKVSGNPSAIAEYLAVHQDQVAKVLITDEIDAHQVIVGFYQPTVDGTTSYISAQDIFKSEAKLSQLQEILQTKLSAYCKLSGGRLFAYALVPSSMGSTDVVISRYSLHLPLAGQFMSAEELMSFGVSTESEADVVASTTLKCFSDIIGEPDAISFIEQASCNKVYVKQSDEFSEIFAACIDSCWVSLKDLLYVQNAMDTVLQTLNAIGVTTVAEYFEMGKVGPTCRLQLPNDFTCDGVHTLDYTCIPGTMRTQLAQGYDEITANGIHLANSLADEYATDAPSVPSADGLILSRPLAVVLGSRSAQDSYRMMYGRLHPDMKTIAQKTETDEFTRTLPSYAELVSVYSKPVDVLATDTDTDTDDDDISGDAQTNFFSDAQDNASVLISYDDLDMEINLSKIPLNSIFTYYNCAHLREALQVTRSKADISRIIGTSKNDELGIQDNELDFYIGLRSLMLEGICIEKSVYTVEQLNALLAEGVSSTVVDSFLVDMAEDAYVLNWSHTGHVVHAEVDMFIDDALDEEDAPSVASLPGRYSVVVNEKTGKFTRIPDTINNINTEINGFVALRGYATEHVSNSFVWIEILIRLLRWGSRKPAALSVPSMTKRMYMDMQSLVISDCSNTVNGRMPDMYDCGDGKSSSYTVYSDITLEVPDSNHDTISDLFGESLAAKKYPCGVVLRTTYKDITRAKYTAIDIFTLALLIASGDLAVLGISYSKDSGFICKDTAIQIPKITEYSISSSTREMEQYNAADRFDGFTMDILALLENLKNDTSGFTSYACKLTVQKASVLGQVFDPGVTHGVNIFDIARCVSMRMNEELADTCYKLNDEIAKGTSAGAVLMKDTARARDMTPEMLFVNTMFYTFVGKYFTKLFATLPDSPSLADLLNCALLAYTEVNQQLNSAVRPTGKLEFSDVVACRKNFYVYKVRNKAGVEEPKYYASLPTDGKGQIILWAVDSDVKPPVDASVETRDIQQLWDEIVRPYQSLWMEYASKPRDPQIKKKFEEGLKQYFIVPNSKVYTSALVDGFTYYKSRQARK